MKASDLMTRLDFLEWLILHPGAKEAPILMPVGWFLWVDDTNGIDVIGYFRHRDGRTIVTTIPYKPRPQMALAKQALEVLKKD
jgi:hypothetical protein